VKTCQPSLFPMTYSAEARFGIAQSATANRLRATHLFRSVNVGLAERGG
jgi:hypothetical protein